MIVGYFGVNAYIGKYGLNARQELDQEIVALTSELERLKAERAEGEKRQRCQVFQAHGVTFKLRLSGALAARACRVTPRLAHSGHSREIRGCASR